MKKKLVWVLLALLLLAAGCRGREDFTPADGDDQTVNQGTGTETEEPDGDAGDDENGTDEPDGGTGEDGSDDGEEPDTGGDKENEEESEPESDESPVVIERTGEEDIREAEDGTQLFAGSLYYPNVQVTGRPDVSAKINEVFEAQRQEDADTSAEYLGLAEEEYEYQLEMGMSGFWGFALNRDYMIPFQGANLLTVKEVLYSYAGGVHPNSEILAWNFDLATGEVVELTDLAKEPEQFMAFLEERINRYLEEQRMEDGDGAPLTDGFYPDYQELIREELKAPTWYVSEGNLWIIFNEYVLAPYAAGIIETKVPLADCQEYLTEEAIGLLTSLPETDSEQ